MDAEVKARLEDRARNYERMAAKAERDGFASTAQEYRGEAQAIRAVLDALEAAQFSNRDWHGRCLNEEAGRQQAESALAARDEEWCLAIDPLNVTTTIGEEMRRGGPKWVAGYLREKEQLEREEVAALESALEAAEREQQRMVDTVGGIVEQVEQQRRRAERAESALASWHCLLQEVYARIDPEVDGDLSRRIFAIIGNCELPQCKHTSELESALAEARAKLGTEPEEIGDECQRCGEFMQTRPGCDPTPECDTCAQQILSEARSALAREAQPAKEQAQAIRQPGED